MFPKIHRGYIQAKCTTLHLTPGSLMPVCMQGRVLYCTTVDCSLGGLRVSACFGLGCVVNGVVGGADLFVVDLILL